MKFNTATLLKQLKPWLGADRMVVGYSGGLDSHVLLAAMAELREQLGDTELTAVHVHHGVNSAANIWTEHCQRVCDNLGIALEIKRVEVDQVPASLENELRNARYRAFEECLGAKDLLLLAHHGDDQTETLLLRLLRGSGARGGAGMPYQRSIGSAALLRPLLGYSRQELEEYAEAKGLNWINDDSNNDQRFDRNYLRHTVIPMLASRWPGFRNTFLRHVEINHQLHQSIEFFVNRELAGLVGENNELGIESLRQYELPVQQNLIRVWIEAQGLPAPGYQQLQKIMTEVMAAREDGNPELNWSSGSVRRYRDALYAIRPLPLHDATCIHEWTMEQPLVDESLGKLSVVDTVGSGLRRSALQQSVSVRFRQGGERCRPAGRQGSHPLKKLLQEYHVPPWLRDRIPLIYVGDQLAAVADLWVCEEFSAKGKEPGYRILWENK